jgi:hypothetical protein
MASVNIPSRDTIPLNNDTSEQFSTIYLQKIYPNSTVPIGTGTGIWTSIAGVDTGYEPFLDPYVC